MNFCPNCGIKLNGGNFCPNCGIKLNNYIQNTHYFISTPSQHIEIQNDNESDFHIENGILIEYNGKNEAVEVPNFVTSIESFAFYKCENLKSITIPDSVTSIGNSAFKECTHLTSIIIPNSITSIGDSAFDGCYRLRKIHIESLEAWCNINWGYHSYIFNCCEAYLYLNNQLITDLIIPNTVTTIKRYAFEGGHFKSISIPHSVKTIEADAFYGCNTTKLKIGNGVISIGADAFTNCSNLKEVHIESLKSWCNIDFQGYCYDDSNDNPVYSCPNPLRGRDLYLNNQLVTNLIIPDNVVEIKKDAFYQCKSITTVEISRSVESIGANAFFCKDLSYISVDNNNPKYASQDGILYNKEMTKFKFIPGKIEGIVTIPNSVTSINSAFEGCTNLTSVNIPDSVTSIGNYAFEGCTNLTSIIIPNSVTSIGDSAFKGCTNLTSIIIPNSVTSIGEKTFDGCYNLKSITIPNSIKTIKNSTFSCCKSLTNINIPNSVTSIEENAFWGCDNLKSVYYKGSIEVWLKISFSKVFSNPLSYGATLYIDNTPITDLVLPNTITSIECSTLNHANFKSIIIPNSVTSIGDSAFKGCTNLTSIIIPNSVTSIGENAFWGCYNLKSITIPISVAHIGKNAFEGCTNLTNVYYTGSINYWCNILHFQSKYSNPLYYGANLYIKNTLVLNLIIPNGNSRIKKYAFTGGNFKSVIIPNSVKSIGAFAFGCCKNLTIYCETENEPFGWDSSWNYSNNPVVWGYTEEN